MINNSDNETFLVPYDFFDLKTLAAAKVELVLRCQARKTGTASPTIATLSRITGCDRGTVSRAIKDLVTLGRLERVVPGRGRRPTVYRLTQSPPIAAEHSFQAERPAGGCE